MVKAVTKLCNGITVVLLVGIFAVLGALVVPRFFGYDMFAVLSGSMEPTYHVGSVVYVNKKVTPEMIQAGDPVTFRMEGDVLVTHRVIEVQEDERQFITQGDANDVPDPAPVLYEQVVGRASLSIPLIGYLVVNIKTSKGLFGLAAVFIVFILLQLIPEILKPEKGGGDEGRTGKRK